MALHCIAVCVAVWLAVWLCVVLWYYVALYSSPCGAVWLFASGSTTLLGSVTLCNSAWVMNGLRMGVSVL